MKLKGILFLFITIIAAGIWLKFRPNTPIQESKNQLPASQILVQDQARLEQNLKPEIKSSKHWDQINNYSIKVQNLVTTDNAKELFKTSQDSVKDLTVCLKKDFCGMERRNDDDAYFDDKKTPGHILLGRNLEIMMEALRIEPKIKEFIDWDLIRDQTDSENEKIQVLALEILKSFGDESTDTNKLITIAEKYKGSAKAQALEKIASQISNKDRIHLINAIEQSFATDDPDTVINLVERLNSMQLTKEQILKTSRNLCRFKENGTDDPNWKMIKYNMGKLVDFESVCN